MKISLTIDDKGLQRKLKAMTPQETGKVFTQAISAVSGPLVRAVKANTPVGPTGNLKRSIARNTRKYRGGKLVFGFVGPNWWNQGRHGHLVEHGTTARYTKTGKSTGVAQPRPFLKPVFDANIGTLQAGLEASLKNQLDAWWKK